MGNQQPSTFEERLYFLARNAKFGDGYLWKHPESKNYKLIYTSTSKELLEAKYKIAPEIFTTGVVPATVGKGNGRYKNAKQMYRLASNVHPIFTEIAQMHKEELYPSLTVQDFGLWYLDDGCLIWRKEKGRLYPRFVLSIGDCCETEEKEKKFTGRLIELFGEKYGRIVLNNSKATQKNKSWIIPKPIALQILEEAKKYGVLPHKFPHGEGSTAIETMPNGGRE